MPTNQRETAVVAAGCAALLALAAYLTTLDNPFVFDDFNEVVQNASLRDPSNIRALLLRFPSRPLTNILYLAAFTATGLNPLAYHAISIVLHTVNVVLLYWLVLVLQRQMSGEAGSDRARIMGAFAAASLFAVHPLMTEAVGYTSSQSELLYSMFLLASLLCFIRVLSAQSAGGYALGAMLFVLGLLSKETTAVLPLILIAYDWTVLGDGAEARWARVKRVHAPLLLTVMVLGLARVWLYLAIEHPAGPGPQWQSVWLELHVMLRYAALLVWPSGQTIVQPVAALSSLLDVRVMAVCGALASTVFVARRYRSREPVAVFGVLWFFLLLLPSSALLVISNLGQPMAEHRAYLASGGLLMVVGSLVARAWRPGDSRRRISVGSGVAVVLVALLTLTLSRNRAWDDPVALWEEATMRAPGTWMAHYGLAHAQLTSGNGEAAVSSLERALAINPGNPDTYPLLAETLIGLGRRGQARAVLQAGLLRAPASTPLRELLARLEASESS